MSSMHFFEGGDGQALGLDQRSKSTQPRRTLLATSLTFTKSCLLYSLAIWGAFTIIANPLQAIEIPFKSRISSSIEPRGCDCGESVAEAISRGCRFDGLAMAWLPEHCLDDELAEEFNTMGDGSNGTWIYYADRERTIQIDPNEVAALGDRPEVLVHMSVQWHTIHCIFYWRKQFRTRSNGKIVEPRSDSEHHIKHCGEIFLSPGSGTKSGWL
ncbi:hypothetical protein N7471_002158 [Penicillium samsonianum]|uniref:uncharacterized protein n=1 Tax=Penicillium samsonianum TaxID=1882272 RepID=UPI0025498212|nr:uncharacterized protein N7471_002158 [Penicillium samsonianum]KAJ6142705.1 hypothetical protein N7471_002158 [Penicillium samsonianum]